MSDLRPGIRRDVEADGSPAFPLGPPFPLKLRPAWLFLICLATVAAALAIDLTFPADHAVGVLYVVAMLLASWLPWRRVTLALALTATAFLVLGYLASPASQGLALTPAITTPAMLNRAFFVLLLWLAAALAVSHQASRLALGRIQDDLSAKEARLRSILDTAPEAIVTIDERGTIESFSRSAERAVRLHGGGIVGRNVQHAHAAALQRRAHRLSRALSPHRRAAGHRHRPHGRGPAQGRLDLPGWSSPSARRWSTVAASSPASCAT